MHLLPLSNINELHQTKKILHSKGLLSANKNKIKRQPAKWGTIFTDTSNKGLISKIYKELTKPPKKI